MRIEKLTPLCILGLLLCCNEDYRSATDSYDDERTIITSCEDLTCDHIGCGGVECWGSSSPEANSVQFVALDDDFVDNDWDGFDEIRDCDDYDAKVNPGAWEDCDDSIDNNCDNEVDCEDDYCYTYVFECGGDLDYECWLVPLTFEPKQITQGESADFILSGSSMDYADTVKIGGATVAYLYHTSITSLTGEIPSGLESPTTNSAAGV